MSAQRAARVASRMAEALLTIELAVVALLVCATAVCSVLGFAPYCILTGSMAPEMPAGTLVWVDAHADPFSLAPGDVVAFESASGTEVTHRVVENDVDERLIETKGDANEASDPAKVPYSQVIGKTIFAMPGAGALLSSIVASKVAIIAVALAANVALLAAPPIIGRIGRKGRTDRIDQGAGSPPGKEKK